MANIKCWGCGKVFKTQAGFDKHKHPPRYRPKRRPFKNPVSSVKSEGWVPCHAVRVVGDQIELLTEGKQRNPSTKKKLKALVSKLKRAIKK